MKNKSISLTFRGFNVPLDEVEHLIGSKATKSGLKGKAVRPGVKSVLTKSFSKFSIEFEPSYPLYEMVPSLLAHLGGLEHLCAVKEQISPEHFEIDIVLPIKHSVEQEGGFISPSTLGDLCRLNATLSFQFL